MKKYWLFFVLAVFAYLIRFYFLGFGIYGDGNGYYVISHTVFFEKKLNFDPIIKNLSNFKAKKYTFNRIFWKTDKTKTGVRNIPWLIGTSLFWLPSLAVISFINIIFKLGIDRFSVFYELGPGITGIILGLAGLYFLEKYLKNFFKEKTVLLTVIGLLFGTNLIYYIFFEPALSHQISFFIISYLLYKSYQLKINQLNIFVIGFLSGLLLITRIPEVIFLIPIYYQIIKDNQKKISWPLLTLFIIGFLIGQGPQIIFQKIMYSSFFANPYFIGQKGSFTHFQLIGIFNHLFSASRGFFSWSPILLLGIVGAVGAISPTSPTAPLGVKAVFKKNYREFFLVFISVFLIYTFLITFWDPYVSAGFGDRFFIVSIPYLGLGLAYFIDKYWSKKTIVLVVFLCLWNFLLLNQFFFSSRRLTDGKNLSFQSLITEQINTPLKVIRLIKEKGYNNTIYKYYVE